MRHLFERNRSEFHPVSLSWFVHFGSVFHSLADARPKYALMKQISMDTIWARFRSGRFSVITAKAVLKPVFMLIHMASRQESFLCSSGASEKWRGNPAEGYSCSSRGSITSTFRNRCFFTRFCKPPRSSRTDVLEIEEDKRSRNRKEGHAKGREPFHPDECC